MQIPKSVREKKKGAGHRVLMDPGTGQQLLQWSMGRMGRRSSQERGSSTGTQHGMSLIPQALAKRAAQILSGFIDIYDYLLSIISKPGTVQGTKREHPFPKMETIRLCVGTLKSTQIKRLRPPGC